MKRLIVIFNGTPEDFRRARGGLSGGDRILFESLRVWARDRAVESLEILTCPSGRERVRLYAPEIMDKLVFHVLPVPAWMYRCFPLVFLWKTLVAMVRLMRMPMGEGTTVFAASDLFPDSLPAWAARVTHPRIRWVCAFFFTAASPFDSRFPYRGFVPVVRGIFYYYTQAFCFWLIRRRADHVTACNEIDRRKFLDAGFPPERVTTLYGGVNMQEADAVPEPPQKTVDAVFMARFHAQKGPLHAVYAWSEVIKVLPGARLVMIGNGAEEGAIRKAIAEHGLQDRIQLPGFLDGAEKYRVFKSARLFLMPSIYETGTMAAVEGMAAGLPVVAYDQEGYRHAYAGGMVTVAPVGDWKALARKVLDLLTDEKSLREAAAAARREAARWDWNVRAGWLMADLRGTPRQRT